MCPQISHVRTHISTIIKLIKTKQPTTNVQRHALNHTLILPKFMHISQKPTLGRVSLEAPVLDRGIGHQL